MTLVVTVAMVLRAWAIFNRSKIILGVLLTLYTLEVVPLAAACIINSVKHTGI